MAKAGTLRVNIVGDAGPLEKTLKGTSSKIGGFAKTVGKVGVGSVVALGAAAVTSAFKTAELGDEIAKTAPKMGISTDALQEMRYWAERNGVSSEDLEKAVGRLNTRIGEAATGTGKYAEAFESLGVPVKDANGEIRETSDVMADSIAALSAIEDPAARAERATELFGQKLGRELMPALEDGALSMEDAAKMAHEMGLVMDEDATKAAERFQDSWADIKDSGAALLRDFGTPVMEFMGNQLFPVIQDKVIPALKDFGEWIGPKLQTAGAWLGDFFNNVVLPAFHRLSDWWTANGPQIIAAAQTLWDGLQGIFGALTEAWNTVVGMFQSGGDSTNGVFAEIQKFAQEVWPQIQAVIGSAMDAIQALIERVTAIVQGIWERWGEDIMAWMRVVWETIQTVISGALDVIQGIWETFAGLFSGDWGRMWDGIKQILSGVWEVIGGIVDLALENLQLLLTIAQDAIRELWDNLWTWVKDTVSAAWEDLNEAVSDGVDEVLDFFRELPGNMLDALGDLGDMLKDAGRQILGGLWSGMTEKWDDLTGWLGGLGGQIQELKGPIEKDRVLLTDIGQEIIGGLGRGMDAEWSKVEKKLGTMTAEIPLTVSGATPGPDVRPVPASAPQSAFNITQNFYGTAPGMGDDAAMSLKKLAILGAY